MAVVRIYDMPWSSDQYDQVIAKLNADGPPPAGVLHHAAGRTAAGMRVVEIYESAEVADGFIQQRVAPAATGLGLPLPDMSGFTVHRSVGLSA